LKKLLNKEPESAAADIKRSGQKCHDTLYNHEKERQDVLEDPNLRFVDEGRLWKGGTHPDSVHL
jgi:hypothetical protein